MKVPKGKFISKYKERINYPVEKLFALNAEREMRCGDGSGNGTITSHSINCRCEEIQKEINSLRA